MSTTQTKTRNFSRTYFLGTGDFGRVFVFCRYEKGRLSLSGVQGPKSNGDCRGACGQIQNHLLESVTDFNAGWSKETVQKLQEIWEKWHLNDMQAGSPRQTEAIEKWQAEGNKYDYKEAVKYLESIGLLEDSEYTHNGQPYRYGTAWLTVKVPEEVLDWLEAFQSSLSCPSAWDN